MRRQALKIGDVVVAGISINVVHMVVWRNRAMMVFPYGAVEQLAGSAEVSAVHRLLRVFVPPIPVTIENHDLNFAWINCALESHTTSSFCVMVSTLAYVPLAVHSG
jgi:hypothetical protein